MRTGPARRSFILRCGPAYGSPYDPGSGSRALPYEDFFEDLPIEERGMLEIIREDNEARNSLG